MDSEINKKYKPELIEKIQLGDELFYIGELNKINSEKITKTYFLNETKLLNGLPEIKQVYILTTDTDKQINFDEIMENKYFLSKDDLKNFIKQQ